MLPEVKIIRNSVINLDTRWNYKNSCGPYNTVYFVTGGDGHIKVNDKIMDLEKGRAYLIPKNVTFSVWCDSYIEKFFAYFTSEIVEGYDIFENVSEILSIDYDCEDIRNMIEKNNNPTLKNEMYIHGEIQKVLSEYLPDDYEFNKSVMQFKPMLDYIAKHISSQMKVNEIAELYHWNGCVLSRKFKNIFGVTLKKYIEIILLNKIKQELIFTDKNIKEISSEYRFCDQYYMSGFFKKFTGFSPKDYRYANDTFQSRNAKVSKN